LFGCVGELRSDDARQHLCGLFAGFCVDLDYQDRREFPALAHGATAEAGSVAAANQHAGKRFEDLYQRTIDWGGHPNERSVTGNMKMIEEPDRRVMLAIMLHGDGAELDMALKTAAQCGMVSLELLQVLYNAKFELLGINAAMLHLRKGL
jgi:hypothetical protein